MAAKRIVAPDTPVRSFPTPNIDDLVVVVDVDSRLPGYKPLDYGTLFPDQTRFPGAKLVYQEPLDGTDSFVRRIYATDRANQDSYNYAIKFSLGSPDHPIYIRTYLLPRADYQPLPDGSVDPVFDNAYIVDEETAPVEGELNSLYVRVTRVFETLPGPLVTSFTTNEAGQKVTVTSQRKLSSRYTFPAATATKTPSATAEDSGIVVEEIRTVPSVFPNLQYSQERPDIVPTQFRDQVPTTSFSQTEEGQASPVTLTGDEISKSQEQVTQFTRRTQTVTRPNSLTTDSLSGKAFNTEFGVEESITDSLVAPDSLLDPTGLIVDEEITPLSSTLSRKVRRTLQTLPAPYTTYETAEGNIVVAVTREVLTRHNPLPAPVFTTATMDIQDSPLQFPYVLRTTKSLPTHPVTGQPILPPTRTEYDNVTYTFPGVIYSWRVYLGVDSDGSPSVVADLSHFENRFPLTMVVAAKFVTTFHLENDPLLDLSSTNFWKVTTRPWAQLVFGLPDNTIHPPAPVTLRSAPVLRNNVRYTTSGGLASDPGFYEPGQELLISGEVKQWRGNVWYRRLTYVKEPIET